MQKRFWSGLANQGWNRLAWLVGLGLALLVITIVLPEFPPEAKAASSGYNQAGFKVAGTLGDTGFTLTSFKGQTTLRLEER